MTLKTSSAYDQAMYRLEQEIAQEEYNELMAEMDEADIGFEQAQEEYDFYE